MYFMARSSISVLIVYKPMRCASGAYTYTVSEDILSCFSRFILSSVRILCSRSDSLIKITRGSSVSVSNIFLKFSACCEAFTSMTLAILVRPSTILVISSPNSLFISSSEMSVSSTVSSVSYTHLDVYKRQP